MGPEIASNNPVDAERSQPAPAMPDPEPMIDLRAEQANVGVHLREIRYASGEVHIQELFRIQGVDPYVFTEILTEIRVSRPAKGWGKTAVIETGDDEGAMAEKVSEALRLDGAEPVRFDLSRPAEQLLSILGAVGISSLVFADQEAEKRFRNIISVKETVSGSVLADTIVVEKVYAVEQGSANAAPMQLLEERIHIPHEEAQKEDLKEAQAERVPLALGELKHAEGLPINIAEKHAEPISLDGAILLKEGVLHPLPISVDAQNPLSELESLILPARALYQPELSELKQELDLPQAEQIKASQAVTENFRIAHEIPEPLVLQPESALLNPTHLPEMVEPNAPMLARIEDSPNWRLLADWEDSGATLETLADPLQTEELIHDRGDVPPLALDSREEFVPALSFETPTAKGSPSPIFKKSAQPSAEHIIPRGKILILAESEELQLAV